MLTETTTHASTICFAHSNPFEDSKADLPIALRIGKHICMTKSCSTKNPIPILVSFSYLSSTYSLFAFTLSTVSVPISYREALLARTLVYMIHVVWQFWKAGICRVQ